MTKATLPEGRKPIDSDWVATKLQDFSAVTRIEVISNKHGRIFTTHNINSVELQIQDSARTLKLFISEEG
jgi:hypothetical protein